MGTCHVPAARVALTSAGIRLSSALATRLTPKVCDPEAFGTSAST